MTDIIKNFYNIHCSIKRDIDEHLPTLRKYANECSSIVELGVRDVVSTWAFAYGLYENDSNIKNIVMVDVIRDRNVDIFLSACESANIKSKFILSNSVTADIGDNIDLLFIDTLHVYGHLKRELSAHFSKVNKYIIMHDTELFKNRGMDCNGHDTLGYSSLELEKGLGPAIDEFLAEHPEWSIHEHYTNCNGLTILKKNVH